MSNKPTEKSNIRLTHRLAASADCEDLSALVKSAYRGESSHQGWTTEDPLVGGQRTDAEHLADMIKDENYAILMFFDQGRSRLVGCAYVHKESTPRVAKLGMLTVRPDLQAQGYGKIIIATAEDYAIKTWDVKLIEMNVIACRTELVAYYNRRGYIDKGRRRPFPMDAVQFGVPKRSDLEFCVLEKSEPFVN